jgi:hypothetical protein
MSAEIVPLRARPETTIHHHVTIDYGRDGYAPSLSLTCSAPADSWCRAEWECACEEFSWSETTPDGRPVHTTYDPDADDDVEHVGSFGGECTLVDWFAGSDEVMRGKVTVPAEPKWDGNGYEFVLGGEAS